MEYKKENKICQNCKTDFIIEPDDFGFYEKIKVPPPTFCRWCRFLRRSMWRNERVLYKRSCDLCQKITISMYPANSQYVVYCRDCWWSDEWDAGIYATEYDMSRNFFDQYRELLYRVPRMALMQRNVTNSDYSNMIAECKNVYLSCSVVQNSENVFYSKSIDNSKDIMDSLNVITGSEGLYENVEAQGNYNSQHMFLCRSCIDSYFLVDCVNCSNCFMSYNLRNKKFCIRNQQYTKEEYFKELEKYDLGSRTVRNTLIKEFEEIKKKAIYRYGNITKCVDVTGNNLLNVKNSKNCFEVYDIEDSKNLYRGFYLKDCRDFDFGGWSEMIYEYTTGAKNNYNLKFSYLALDSVRNSEYTDSCRNCNNVFGCISLNNKEYTILNKTYTKEEYFKLRDEIITQMNKTPYVDQKGREYRYGEFFPSELSPYGYNETPAYEFEPLTKNETSEKGYPWKDEEVKNFKITMNPEDVPDKIGEVDESIQNEVIGCSHKGECRHQCNFGFKITNYEYSFYKKMNIPLPVLCPNCRYFERMRIMPGLKLHTRKCMKDGCINEFETAYAPDRPEIIYCEKCYQQEVY